MKFIFLSISLLCTCCINAQDTTYVKIPKRYKVASAPAEPPAEEDEANGYATGTTGGEGGTETTVTTKAGFVAAVAGSSAKIVYVSGTIDIDYQLIGSNTTIYGLAGAGLIGTLRIQGTNVIVRNLTLTAPFDGTDQDAIGIAGGTYVWVDHCTIYDWTDGAVDCTVGADFITISWCWFYQTTDYVHAFPNLIGASDGASGTDAGKLHVTLHHNWFGENLKARMARVRFGRVHEYNNYFNSATVISDVSVYMEAAIEGEILGENNYCESGEDFAYKTSGQNGKILTIGNYVDPAVTGATTSSDLLSFTIPYPYTLDAVMGVKATVMAGAGATL